MLYYCFYRGCVFKLMTVFHLNIVIVLILKQRADLLLYKKLAVFIEGPYSMLAIIASVVIVLFSKLSLSLFFCGVLSG